MRIRTLLLPLLLMLLLPAAAPAEEKLQIYTIKKGDTLWGISERFIKDPYYWPNLWSNNPFITNPHLIYPGQEVAIYDGRMKIIGTQPEPSAAPETSGVPAAIPPAETPDKPATTEPLPEPQEEIIIKTLGGAEGFVSVAQMARAGSVVDTVDNRIMMAEGDTVFCKMADLAGTQPGDAFDIIAPGKEIRHPVSNALLGHQVASVGTLIILSADQDVATARITDSNQEIQRGNLLVPFKTPTSEIALKQAQKQLFGYIIAARQGKLGLGQNDIIYIDLGENDGLEVGNLLYMTRPRQQSEVIREKTDIKLPEVLLGSAVVLETEGNTASALVLKAVDAIVRGDLVRTIVE